MTLLLFSLVIGLGLFFRLQRFCFYVAEPFLYRMAMATFHFLENPQDVLYSYVVVLTRMPND